MKLVIVAFISAYTVFNSYKFIYPNDAKSFCTPSVTTASGFAAKKDICSGELIFEENFDKLRFDVWQHENTLAGGGNWEFQWYTNNRSNSFVKDGALHIRPTLTADDLGEGFLTSGVLDVNGGSPADYCTDSTSYGCQRTGSADHIINPIKSAALRSVNSFAFKYGKLEARARLPAGDWLWPAIWLMPKHNAYSTWPSSGELDLVESRGNRKLFSGSSNVGVEQMGSTVHFGPKWNARTFISKTKNTAPDQGYDKDFHRYQLEWTPDKLVFRVDDQLVNEIVPPKGGFWELGGFGKNNGRENPWALGSKMAPFDEEFYVIINLAVGGTGYFSDSFDNHGAKKPWSNTSPRAMSDFWAGRGGWLSTWKLNDKHSYDSSLKVDYVKVWAL